MRLAAAVPRLTALSIAVTEGGQDGTVAVEHVRHVVVAAAPALFESRCATCKGGTHEYTAALMRELHLGAPRIVVESTCDGTNGTASCSCLLRLVATATYRE